MAKKQAAAQGGLVKVQLTCTYSGFPGDPVAGEVIEVEADEAERLIENGAAVKPANEAPESE